MKLRLSVIYLTQKKVMIEYDKPSAKQKAYEIFTYGYIARVGNFFSGV